MLPTYIVFHGFEENGLFTLLLEFNFDVSLQLWSMIDHRNCKTNHTAHTGWICWWHWHWCYIRRWRVWTEEPYMHAFLEREKNKRLRWNRPMKGFSFPPFLLLLIVIRVKTSEWLRLDVMLTCQNDMESNMMWINSIGWVYGLCGRKAPTNKINS